MVECRKFLTLNCMDKRLRVSLSGKEKKIFIKIKNRAHKDEVGAKIILQAFHVAERHAM